jgi:hypothetical protein
MTAQQRRWLERRQAIGPAIGHLETDHRMNRCWLAGSLGDALYAVLCVAGYNLQQAAAHHRPRAHQATFFRSWVGSAPMAAHRVGDGVAAIARSIIANRSGGRMNFAGQTQWSCIRR